MKNDALRFLHITQGIQNLVNGQGFTNLNVLTLDVRLIGVAFGKPNTEKPHIFWDKLWGCLAPDVKVDEVKSSLTEGSQTNNFLELIAINLKPVPAKH